MIPWWWMPVFFAVGIWHGWLGGEYQRRMLIRMADHHKAQCDYWYESYNQMVAYVREHWREADSIIEKHGAKPEAPDAH